MPNHATATAMPPAVIVLLLSLLLGLQPITTDLYLPALPVLTAGFGAPMQQAQLTLTALLLAFGVSQLVWGPLSDRFGRRPILLIGLSAYVLAAVGSALAPSMTALIVWRTVQGAAMGAGVMCARAIVRDLYAPAQGAGVMSKGLSGLGVIAFLSAPLGGLMTEAFNWRFALLSLAVFGAVALGLIAWRFEETLQRKNPAALQTATLMSTWKSILRHPTFLAFSALSASSYGGLFTFLATSSFVFMNVLGLSKTHYGALMALNSLAYIGGTFLCRHWLPRFGVRRSLKWAGVLSLAGGTLMAGLSLAGMQNVWAIMLPQLLFIVGHGIHQPCGQSGAVGPFPHAAGAASALNGFLMMLAAFAMGSWLGNHMDGTVLPLTLGVWFWSALIALSAWTLVQKYGEPHAA
ncbi:multidrug effflux MFS transporter [Rhodoferax sp.]|uniref:multidrug effflux MFS transporter n=1 Tax=Rhodoferax sp. TaxID=50421 RepID=UPI00272001CB|nr:multidrug effflux MFS transporter [Rhodoferax sp.]MDO9142732.1 multidrug effflux MFS transporter [Rhodoferax sp.]MDP3865641.1 multidrug effflux MFS transporter [Rhodoferax sp.]MDZ4207303.1 multidrug effflux MFS transporter [Rhodoferax sp.]